MIFKKAFYKSKTVHGLAIAVLGLIFMIFDFDIGKYLNGVGMLWTFYGRVVANKPLGLTDQGTQD